MTALHRKLRRDLWYLRGPATAIALVIACGVATFVMSVSVLQCLERARDHYYADARFAHLFAHVKRAPRALVGRLAEVPGVAAVQARVVVEAVLDMPGMAEPVVGRFVSLPDFDEPSLNRLHLRRGRWPEAGRRGEVLASEAFATAHGLAPGDRIHAILNGRRQELTIAGVALSPEYVYSIRGGNLFPDDRRFGVLWMRERPLAAAFDLHEAFNDVCFLLTPDAVEAAVAARVDRLLARYGSLGATGRTEQVSHRYVSDELTQLRTMAYMVPAIFLLVAAFVLNVVLNRVIGTQREQIAALKAFGYTRAELGAHYGQMALVIVLFGVALGTAVGGWLGGGLAELYARFFRFPVLDYRIGAGVFGLAAMIAVGAGAAAVVAALARVMRLPPAEAMRPEAPAAYRASWFEKARLRRWLRPGDRMVLRQVSRRPLRSAFSVAGIALGVAVMVLGSFSEDMVQYIVDFQFGAVQHHDLSVGFTEPTSATALAAAARLPGVMRAEPFRSVPVLLAHGHHQRRVALLGLPADGRLLQLRDRDARPVAVPDDGVLLSEKLADLLEARPGDLLEVEVLERGRKRRLLRLAATLQDFSGLSAYLEIGALRRFLREGATVSGVLLRVDPAAEGTLHARLKAAPRVAVVSSQADSLRSFQETFSENLARMRVFNVVFAGIIVFGVVYNAARITLAERARELATLRVVGLTRGEVAGLFIGEVAVLLVPAVPLGLVLGRTLTESAVRALETETQRFPVVIYSSTYAAAAATALVAALGSCLIVRGRIAGLDLLAVLKSRD